MTAGSTIDSYGILQEVGRRPIYLASAFLGAMCNVLAALCVPAALASPGVD
jgi:hypothetical protein